jgi:hypothetical protein
MIGCLCTEIIHYCARTILLEWRRCVKARHYPLEDILPSRPQGCILSDVSFVTRVRPLLALSRFSQMRVWTGVSLSRSDLEKIFVRSIRSKSTDLAHGTSCKERHVVRCGVSLLFVKCTEKKKKIKLITKIENRDGIGYVRDLLRRSSIAWTLGSLIRWSKSV